MTGPENAPLYHFIPGHKRLALASAGCNLRCRYCQNWQISQIEADKLETEKREYFELSPKETLNLALTRGAESISFTYTEPVVACEYVHDIFNLARNMAVSSAS